MSGFSSNEAKGIIKGAIAPDFRKLICAVKDLASDPQTLLMEDYHPNNTNVLTPQDVYLESGGLDAWSTQTHTNTRGDDLVATHQIVSTTDPDGITYFNDYNGDRTYYVHYAPDATAGTNTSVKCTLNRPFTGIIDFRFLGVGFGTPGNTVGDISFNVEGTSPAGFNDIINIVDNGDGSYSQNDPTQDAYVGFYVTNVTEFYYTIIDITTFPVTTWRVDFEEFSTRFQRDISIVDGSPVITDLTFDGQPYTVQGTTSVVVGEEDEFDKFILDNNPNGTSSYSAAIQNGVATLSIASIPSSDNIRIVNAQVEQNTRYSIDLTLSDGTTIQHQAFGGSYQVELKDNQPSITDITVTELDGTATRAIINTLSKTRSL